MTAGKVLAFAFLVTLFVGPVQMGTQILTDAQNAIVSWRRVIGILETPADLVDPGPDGQVLPRGPLDVTFDDVTFAYPDGPPTCSPTCRCTSMPARASRSWGRPGRASPPSPSC